jgi:hypothetical protein
MNRFPEYLYHLGYKEKVKVLNYKSYIEEYEVERANGHVFRDFKYNFREINIGEEHYD